MHKIKLVCSVHSENGLCNAGELLKILQEIEPEVVFEEIRPSDFDSYYKHGTNQVLETQAIKKYAEFKSFQQVPVDRYNIPEDHLAEIKRDFDRVLDCVEGTSREYLDLTKQNDNNACRYGFNYLNSVECAEMMARISEIEEKTIIGTADQDLIRGLERWRHLIQRRDFEMIENIYEYCRENVFDTGVFLIGAAHKTGIVKEIERYANTEADLIIWNFAYDSQIS